MKSLYRGALLITHKYKDGGSHVTVWHPFWGDLKIIFAATDESYFVTDISGNKLTINDIDIESYEQKSS